MATWKRRRRQPRRQKRQTNAGLNGAGVSIESRNTPPRCPRWSHMRRRRRVRLRNNPPLPQAKKDREAFPLPAPPHTPRIPQQQQTRRCMRLREGLTTAHCALARLCNSHPHIGTTQRHQPITTSTAPLMTTPSTAWLSASPRSSRRTRTVTTPRRSMMSLCSAAPSISSTWEVWGCLPPL